MPVRNAVVFFVLTVTLWHSVEALFENVGKCDENIVKGLESIWNGNTPRNILQEFKKVQPWSVVYASSDLFPADTKSVVINSVNIKVIPETESDPVNVPINWKEEEGVLSDNKLQWHVLSFQTNSIAFYICSSEGSMTTPMGGVAMAVGPIGGIPEETKQAAHDEKKQLKKLGVKLQQTLDLSSG